MPKMHVVDRSVRGLLSSHPISNQYRFTTLVLFDLLRLTPQLALPHVIDIDGIRVPSGYHEVFLETMLWSGLNKPITCRMY
jgi:hypothetical protein